MSTVIVRGSVYNANAVKDGIAKLLVLLTGNSTVILDINPMLKSYIGYIENGCIP